MLIVGGWGMMKLLSTWLYSFTSSYYSLVSTIRDKPFLSKGVEVQYQLEFRLIEFRAYKSFNIS
jgi:hypothetical protein